MGKVNRKHGRSNRKPSHAGQQKRTLENKVRKLRKALMRNRNDTCSREKLKQLGYGNVVAEIDAMHNKYDTNTKYQSPASQD